MRAAQLAHQRATRWRRILIVGAAVLAVVVVSVIAVVALQQSNQPSAVATATSAGDPAGEMPYPPNATTARDGIVVSDNKSVPDVGLYFDYQCSHCVAFEQSFGGALALLGQTGEIRLVHHTRVFLDQGNQAGLSHKAALAAACSDVVGAYIDYHSAVLEAATSGPYTDQLLLETIPAKVGITGSDLTAFRACYSNQNLARFVQAVDDAAGMAGINETPTLTVNGTAVPISSFDGKTGEDLKGIIEDAAKR